MLIDEYLPVYDYVETHDVEVAAPAATVYRAVLEADLCESWIVRTLFFLRGLPTEKVTLRMIRQMRFEILGEQTDREIVLGLAGRFWTPAGDLREVNAENFRAFREKGCAKAAWNFSLDEKSDSTLLATETRIQCLDEASRRSFSVYWTLIAPFSGWIRREMLATIKRRAEATDD